jgi:membrane-bound lytic murein transglycosylase D
MIVREIERRDMPMELALLPEIESSYNPRALSPKSASGMWQFIPSTGTRMGLAQNDWYDGRNDIVASTRAALAYLKGLHDDLGGDWALAIAAYNCGPERVRAAQQANRSQGKPTDFWSLDLPGDTEAYVPQLLAIAQVVAAPGRYGLAMPRVPDRPQLELVHVASQVDLGQAARVADISPATLSHLNAGLKQGKTQPNGPHTLLVPAGAAQRSWSSAAARPSSFGRRLRWRRQTVTGSARERASAPSPGVSEPQLQSCARQTVSSPAKSQRVPVS